MITVKQTVLATLAILGSYMIDVKKSEMTGDNTENLDMADLRSALAAAVSEENAVAIPRTFSRPRYCGYSYIMKRHKFKRRIARVRSPQNKEFKTEE
uniref:Uncharacterized protein n=1 Tax=Rhodnius prolixus TaxID=13249 RepID=T1I1I9_RHOPR